MSNGVDRRAEIDSATAKALLLLNGGGAVALLAFLPAVLEDPGYAPLAHGVLWGLALLLLGLVSAVLHNRYRRVCSLDFERHLGNPPPCRIFPLSLLPLRDDPSCACRLSIVLLWGAILAFLLAGYLVVRGGFRVL
jgi:hypothetical protein